MDGFSHSKEGNQCADFMAKLEVSSDVDLLLHESPPVILLIFLEAMPMALYSSGSSYLFLFFSSSSSI